MSRLAARLYRLDCPTPQELGEYQLGILAQPQAAAVAAHLAECPHCMGEVAQLQGYLADLSADLELSIVERARVLVARLIGGGSSSGSPSLAPAMAGIRGGEPAAYVYQAGDLQVTLMVEPADEQPDQRMLLGLIAGTDSTNWQARLWQAERLVASAPVDADGNFILASLAPASYELTLHGPDLEIYIQELTL
jgi:hypothetical protein